MLLTYCKPSRSAIKCFVPCVIQRSHAFSNSWAFSASMRPVTLSSTAFSSSVGSIFINEPSLARVENESNAQSHCCADTTRPNVGFFCHKYVFRVTYIQYVTIAKIRGTRGPQFGPQQPWR